jgi:dienelactone hydrolase
MFFRRSLLVVIVAVSSVRAEPLPDTKPLTREGDLAAEMVEGIDKYLMRELAASVERRKALWKLDTSSRKAMEKSIAPHRERLRTILGVVDARVPQVELEYVSTVGPSSLVAQTEDYQVHTVRWPVLEGVDAEGLLLEPKGQLVASAVALPDADQTPEMLAGLAEGVPEHAQFARRLAENGCRVLVPTLIDRKDTWSGNPKLGRMTNQPHREFVYRMAYEMGRHILGYEVQKVLAAVDWLTRQKDHTHVGIIGYGEGATLALYAGALDPRIRTTVVVGAFGPREKVWQEPIYRNVWGLLREFGDGEVSLLYNPFRVLQVDHAEGPRVERPPAPRPGRSGAAPGRLVSVDYATMSAELKRWKLGGDFSIRGIRTPGLWAGNDNCLGQILSENPQEIKPVRNLGLQPADRRKAFDPAPRQKRQFDQLVAFTQQVMRDSDRYRQQHFWARLDTSSLEKYQKSCEPFRKQLGEEVIGQLPAPSVPMNPQTRPLYDEPKWKGFEVTLDLYPDVFAYGILLLPKDLQPGEKRPVVVCQHGLEGRPTNVCNPKERTKYYNSFGAQLADRGYIVYAPQNPYIGQDKFRVLQRKANPLGLSLFSFIVRQHERTLDWLATLPHVDPERMAFYGLSYGGKTAMRVPALVPRYCLSICSGDFNEWIRKNVSLDYPSSYMFSPEYEMPEFNLGHTFNYAEMAALIAPRPFMVERGHDDGVGVDEWVAYEYAKVRRLYSRLKIPERTEIEFFAGGHEIHGQGTFRFLQKHLNWPPGSRQ